MTARVLILSGITGTSILSAQQYATAAEEAFRAAGGDGLAIDKAIFPNAAVARELLEHHTALATEESVPLIVLYNGHGDQKFGSKREADGADEMWQPGGGGTLYDDDITAILVGAAPSVSPPFVCLISDSCSSGTMIDTPASHPARAWASIGACADAQSAVAVYNGGVFSYWGLFPALRAGHQTARAISAKASDLVAIPSQTVTVYGTALDTNIFTGKATVLQSQRNA